MGLEPLRVRAWLRTAVICDGTLPLDGILLYQAARERLGPRDVTLPGQGHGASSLHIHGLVPLKELNPGPQWYYACSFAQWPARDEGRAYWEKRFDTNLSDIVDLQGKRGKVDVASGRYRSYHMPVFYVTALWVDWYAVGNIEAIRKLLPWVWAIGKKTVQGWGRVARWEVEPWPEDWSVRRGGELMRPIPIGERSFPVDAQYTGYRPSYWLQENQTLCEVPQYGYELAGPQ